MASPASDPAAPRLRDLLPLLLLSLLCVPLLSPPVGSGDYFWHVTTGRWILDHGALPTVDPFQALGDPRPWTTFQWLYEVLLAWLEPGVGIGGIRLLHGLLGAAALFAWGKHLGRPLGLKGVALWLPAGLFLLLYADRIRIRPHVLNFLVVGALLPVMAAPHRLRGWKAWLGALGAVGLLANLHAGGAMIAVALLWSGVAGVLVSRSVERSGRRRALVLALSAAGAAAIMPGFVAGVGHALRMESATRELFLEWQAPAIYVTLKGGGMLGRVYHVLMGVLPYAAALALVGLIFEVIRRRGIARVLRLDGAPAVGLAVGATLVALRSARFIPFVLAAIPGFAVLLSALRSPGAPAPRRPPRRRRALALALSGLGLVAASHVYRLGFAGSVSEAARTWATQDIVPGIFPVGAADWLEREGATGGVYNVSAFHGSYLIWRLWPRIRVHFDGRGNLSAEEARRIAVLQRHRDDPDYRDAALRYVLEASQRWVLMSPPTFPFGPPRYFSLRYRDRVAELWERER